MVHIRSGRLPSTETGLALCTDRPRAEDPGRSGRSELSGSGPAPGGQERDRLEFQLSLSLHDGSWPSVGPTGPSKDPESRGAMGWKLLLPSHGTAQLAAPSWPRSNLVWKQKALDNLLFSSGMCCSVHFPTRFLWAFIFRWSLGWG